MRPKFNEIIGAILVIGALLVVAYASVIQKDATAMGAAIAIIAAGNGYFLRGKMQSPKD